jgi:hypothetical protein
MSTAASARVAAAPPPPAAAARRGSCVTARAALVAAAGEDQVRQRSAVEHTHTCADAHAYVPPAQAPASLLRAAYKGQLSLVDFLLTKGGADANVTDRARHAATSIM